MLSTELSFRLMTSTNAYMGAMHASMGRLQRAADMQAIPDYLMQDLISDKFPALASCWRRANYEATETRIVGGKER